MPTIRTIFRLKGTAPAGGAPLGAIGTDTRIIEPGTIFVALRGERFDAHDFLAQAKAAGIRMPEVGVYDSPEINAFATGPSRNNALVAVSSGMIRGMNLRQIEGVLAQV